MTIINLNVNTNSTNKTYYKNQLLKLYQQNTKNLKIEKKIEKKQFFFEYLEFECNLHRKLLRRISPNSIFNGDEKTDQYCCTMTGKAREFENIEKNQKKI